MRPFGLISDIAPDDPATWRGVCFLTMDMEWGSEESLDYVLSRIRRAGARLTLFCTHRSPVVDAYRSEDWLELGIHPNFNFLLAGDFRYGRTIDEVIAYYLQFAPGAVSVRSHCMTASTTIFEAFVRHGLHYESNTILPTAAGLPNRPWRGFVPSLVHVPIHWEDDVHCRLRDPMSMQPYLDDDKLMVFNFHPVTLALNIDAMDLYDECRPIYQDHAALMARRHTGLGVDTMLEELLHEASGTR